MTRILRSMRRPVRPASAPPPLRALPAAPAPAATPEAPPDGYVRLPTRLLHRLPLVHLYSEWEASGELAGWSERDETDRPARAHRCGEALDELYGHTEWAGRDDPRVSIGWDWQACWTAGQLRWMAGEVRTNLMLVDERGDDLGVGATQRLLQLHLAHLNWPPAVASALGMRG